MALDRTRLVASPVGDAISSSSSFTSLSQDIPRAASSQSLPGVVNMDTLRPSPSTSTVASTSNVQASVLNGARVASPPPPASTNHHAKAHKYAAPSLLDDLPDDDDKEPDGTSQPAHPPHAAGRAPLITPPPPSTRASLPQPPGMGVFQAHLRQPQHGQLGQGRTQRTLSRISEHSSAHSSSRSTLTGSKGSTSAGNRRWSLSSQDLNRVEQVPVPLRTRTARRFQRRPIRVETVRSFEDSLPDETVRTKSKRTMTLVQAALEMMQQGAAGTDHVPRNRVRLALAGGTSHLKLLQDRRFANRKADLRKQGTGRHGPDKGKGTPEKSLRFLPRREQQERQRRARTAAALVKDGLFAQQPSHLFDNRSLLVWDRLRSKLWVRLRYIICILNLVLTVCEKPAPRGLQLSQQTANYIEYALCAFYVVDLSLERYARGAKYFWNLSRIVRCLCSLGLLVDITHSVVEGGDSRRYMRVLRPVFAASFIAPVRSMLELMVMAVHRAFSVLVLIVVHILTSSLLAFVAFGGIEGNTSFRTFGESVFTCFTMLTTANFPDSMLVSYADNAMYSWFFIYYVVVGAYLLMNLVLAVLYNAFARHTARDVLKRLENVRMCVTLAFLCLAVTPEAAAARSAAPSASTSVVNMDNRKRQSHSAATTTTSGVSSQRSRVRAEYDDPEDDAGKSSDEHTDNHDNAADNDPDTVTNNVTDATSDTTANTAANADGRPRSNSTSVQGVGHLHKSESAFAWGGYDHVIQEPNAFVQSEKKFEALATETQGRVVDRAGWEALCQELRPNFSQAHVDVLWLAMDENQDNGIDETEFFHLCRYLSAEINVVEEEDESPLSAHISTLTSMASLREIKSPWYIRLRDALRTVTQRPFGWKYCARRATDEDDPEVVFNSNGRSGVLCCGWVLWESLEAIRKAECAQRERQDVEKEEAEERKQPRYPSVSSSPLSRVGMGVERSQYTSRLHGPEPLSGGLGASRKRSGRMEPLTPLSPGTPLTRAASLLSVHDDDAHSADLTNSEHVYTWFDFVGDLVVIVCSAFTLAEASLQDTPGEWEERFSGANHFFLAFFVFELILRWLSSLETSYWHNGFGLFDTLLVGATVAVQWGLRTSPGVAAFLRLCRVSRVIHHVRGIRVVMATLSHIIGPPSLGLLGVLLLFFHEFAVIGVELFRGQLSAASVAGTTYAQVNYFELHFDDVAAAAMTLFSMLVVSKWRIIMAASVQATSEYARVYFVAYYLIGLVMVMNLVVAFLLDSFIFFQNQQTAALDQQEEAEFEEEEEEEEDRVIEELERANSKLAPALEEERTGRAPRIDSPIMERVSPARTSTGSPGSRPQSGNNKNKRVPNHHRSTSRSGGKKDAATAAFVERRGRRKSTTSSDVDANLMRAAVIMSAKQSGNKNTKVVIKESPSNMLVEMYGSKAGANFQSDFQHVKFQ